MLNKDIFPIQSNLYEYDFMACSYNILKNLGYDVSKIPFENKLQRNISIGWLIKENPNLNTYIKNNTKNLLELYIEENNLKPDEIIWRQKDGFITNRLLENNNITIELTLRNCISHLISSMNRDKVLIIYDDNKIDIKGVRNKPIDLSFFELFLSIDFSNKKKLLERCEIIRQKFLKSENVNWFVREDSEGKLTIPLKGDVLFQVNKSMLKLINTDDIDKNIIYETYVYPFFQTLLICYNT